MGTKTGSGTDSNNNLPATSGTATPVLGQEIPAKEYLIQEKGLDGDSGSVGNPGSVVRHPGSDGVDVSSSAGQMKTTRGLNTFHINLAGASNITINFG